MVVIDRLTKYGHFIAAYSSKPVAATDGNDSTEVQQLLSGRDVLLSQLRANLTKFQQRMKDHADKKRRDCSLMSAPEAVDVLKIVQRVMHSNSNVVSFRS
jgi:hypothetical protein